MDASEQINELAGALAKAQGQIVPAKFDGQNPHLKNRYTTLAAVWDAIRKPLSDNGLAVAQIVVTEPDGMFLLTRLMHSSGQYVQATYPIAAGDNRGVSAAQAVGSALTYARRYSLTALVGVVSDDDDDGNSASAPQTQRQAQPQPRQPEPPKAKQQQAQQVQAATNGDGLPFANTKRAAVDWAMQHAPQVWPVNEQGYIVRSVVERSFDNCMTANTDKRGADLGRAWVAKIEDKLATWQKAQETAPATDATDQDGWQEIDANGVTDAARF